MHKQLKLFLTANSFFLLAWGMLGPIYALFVKDIGGDVLAAGSSWAAYMIITGIGIFLVGKLQDKIKRDKLFIMLGYGLMSMSFLGYFFISNVVQLFLVQVLFGIGMMIQIPSLDLFYTGYLERGKIASQWAAWEGMYFTITGVAALVGGLLVKLFGFKFLFITMFSLSLISLMLSAKLEIKK